MYGESPLLYFGILLSILAALGWATSDLCVRIGTDKGDVLDATLITLICNLAIFLPITIAIHHPDYGLNIRSIISFICAGLTGSLVARVCKYKGIELIGASRITPIVSSNILFATGFAIIFLDEMIGYTLSIGIMFIFIGISVISYELGNGTQTIALKSSKKVIILVILAIFSLGSEPIFARFGLDSGTPVLPGLVIKITSATFGFLLYLYYVDRSPSRVIFRPPHINWYIGAGVLSTIGTLLYYIALSFAPVVYVVPFVQLSPLFILVISFLFLPKRLEHVTEILVYGAFLTVIGVVLISMTGEL